MTDTDIQPHEADGEVVVTTIGSDGLRWACRTCNETVYQRDGRFLHFRTELNLPDPEPDVLVWCPAHEHYLAFVGGSGTTWALNRDGAKLYHAHEVDEVIRRATWLEHNPEAVHVSEAPR